MSEILEELTEPATEPGTGTGTGTETEPEYTCPENDVIEAVMDLVDSLDNYALITRGALGSGNGITCETATSSAESVFMSKEKVFLLDLTFNAKHTNLKTLSDTVGKIIDYLTFLKEYPSGDGWQIIDIYHGTPSLPTIIGREDQNQWLMAAGVIVKYYRKEIE